MKTVAILALLMVGCGSVEAARVSDAGADSTKPDDSGAGGAGGETPDAAPTPPIDASPDAGTDARKPADASTGHAPCVPRECIVCVNGVPTTPPGTCM